MMDPSSKFYISGFVEIGPLVPEKIWAKLPSWSCDPYDENNILSPPPPTHRGSSQNFALIDKAVSAKMYEH